MNISTIKKLQKKYGVAKIQQHIDSGVGFKQAGHFQELVWSAIYSGACMLPKVIHRDHTNKLIAARQMIRNGQPGSFGYCKKYWEDFLGRLNGIA